MVLHCFADAVGADTAVILGHGDERPEVLSSWARDGHELKVAWTGKTLLGQALTASGPLLDPSDPVEGKAEITAIAAPISSNREALGAIHCSFSPASRESAEALGWAAESYARTAALCMSGDLTLAAVLGSAGFDTLTGCLSYGGLLEVLRAEVQRSLRGGHALSVCFIDLDGFKRVNDTQGHLEGNHVLSAVGQALRLSARTYDAVGRFGGDEFVVVLPETGSVAGASIARRYRAAVLTAVTEATSVPVDASVGIAEWDGAGTALDLLEAADQALADAKAAGGAAIAPASVETQVDGLLELTKHLMRRRKASPADRERDAGA